MQNVIVGLIVLAAALYALWRWMPSTWRRSLATRFAAGGQRAGWIDADKAKLLEARLGKGMGCGTCDSCGACGKSTTAQAPRPAGRVR